MWCHFGAIVAHMNLGMYVDTMRDQLLAAAGSGGPDAKATVERLTPGLEAAMRLALLEAISAAADEITRELAPGAVEVRLRGVDPDFVVTQPVFDSGDASPVDAIPPTVVTTGE